MRVEIRDDHGVVVMSYVTSASAHSGSVENLHPGHKTENRDKCVEALEESLYTLGVGQTRQVQSD